MTYTLEGERLKFAVHAGVARRLDSIAKRRKGAHGFNRDDFWQLDIEGACAEAVVAHSLGLEYAPVTDRLDTAVGDVAPGIQVRSTKYPAGSLIVHDSDADSDKFVLVTGANGKYEIRGWILGVHGKQPSWWKVYKGRGSYWVPQEALHSMKTLRDW